MPAHSPKSRNREPKGGGRLEYLVAGRPPGLLQRGASPEPPSPRHRAVQQLEAGAAGFRRDSGSGLYPCPQPEEDCMKLNPSLLGIALRSLLAIDLWLSKRLGVCATEDSAWGSARPIMKLIEVSGHGIPWIGGTLYCLCKSDSTAGHEVLLNLLLALILDLILVGIVKSLVRRRRPSHNKMDMFATFSVDRYSFPSGHATRAALGGRFFLNHLVLAIPLRILIVLWVCIVGLSRVMLGRHNVTDVVCGFIMGYLQYSLVEYMWLSPSNLQTFLRLCGLK
ncbi:polyisoprenoid diphosphate/phosphate phosphohydrolase PLPP6 [Hemiscyllium ocellatum]|uniref:polyisoprenoid diphosphate/phosphate phosphohydrolase PLPP6 n=1 Tax=Hemiscyllium ocellatum TaxID=170820 RepID=UPI002966B8BB|nr:polyisoprenoid diphosphate/phosphate phosphohydrolase PLPP6 [Hemiscyllium ocellatum]